MMRIPTCPEHGRLVLDLALGRLDDQAAAEAESVRTSCPECAAWWRAELEGELAHRFDHSIETAFESFSPARRRRPAWMPVAAAAALAVGGGLLWYASGTIDEAHLQTLSQESFDGDLDSNGVVDPSDLGFTLHMDNASEAIFDGDLDNGDLTGWNSST